MDLILQAYLTDTGISQVFGKDFLLLKTGAVEEGIEAGKKGAVNA